MIFYGDFLKKYFFCCFILQKLAFFIGLVIASVAADVSHLNQGYNYEQPARQGYDYPKPSIPFELPTQPAPTYLPPDTSKYFTQLS